MEDYNKKMKVTPTPIRIKKNVDPKSLKHHPKNSKIYPDISETADLEMSIVVVGILRAILVNKEYYILSGNRTVTAAVNLGLTEVPIEIINDDENEMDILLHANVSRAKTSKTIVAEALMFMDYAYKIKKEKGMYGVRQMFPAAKDKKFGWDVYKFVSSIMKVGNTNLKKLLYINRVDDYLLDQMDENKWSVDKAYKLAKKTESGVIEQLPNFAIEKRLCETCGHTHQVKIPIKNVEFVDDEIPLQQKVKRTDPDAEQSNIVDMEDFFNTEENKKCHNLINTFYDDSNSTIDDSGKTTIELEKPLEIITAKAWTSWPDNDILSMSDESQADPLKNLGLADFEPSLIVSDSPMNTTPILYSRDTNENKMDNDSKEEIDSSISNSTEHTQSH